jgi:gluconate 5-dehydrogenase
LTSPDDPLRLDGKVAVVTGSTQGLGFEMALALTRAGGQVYINGRSQEGVGAAVARAALQGVELFAAPFDIANRDAAARGLEAVHAETGRLDILVNNVGARLRRPLDEISGDDLRGLLDVDLVAAFELAKQAHPLMRANGYGRIVMVTSISAHLGMRGDAAYAAAKGGLTALVRALACEFGPDGITCNALAPGSFATETNAALAADPARTKWLAGRTPLGRWGRPDEIGSACVFLSAPGSSFMTGAVLTIDGGLTASY